MDESIIKFYKFWDHPPGSGYHYDIYLDHNNLLGEIDSSGQKLKIHCTKYELTTAQLVIITNKMNEIQNKD